MSSKKSNALKGVDAGSARGRREMAKSIIRKEKKDENLMKRRNLSVVSTDEVVTPPVEAWGASTPVEANTEAVKADIPAHHKLTLADFPQMLQNLRSEDIEIQIVSMRGFRRLLSAEKNPPVQQCIDCGVIPIFVEFLQRYDSRDLIFEASWALTNIASTDRTRVVVEANAVPNLVNLLLHEDADVRDQSAWCLGNIAGDSAELRDIVLAQPTAMDSILKNLAQPANLPLMRNCTWTLSNFCRGKPQPPLNVLVPALPALQYLLANSNDSDTTVDACWALSYISDGDNDRIVAVVNQGVVPTLISMLYSEQTTQIVPALRTIGNIVSGNDTCTQAVVDADFISACAILLDNPKRNIRKETCWALSNIAAGSPAQLNVLMANVKVVPGIVEALSSGTEWDVRKEAAWIVSNIATSGQHTHLMNLVENNVIQPLCDLLSCNEGKIILVALEALEAILKLGTTKGGICANYANLIQECDGVERMETLQEHKSNEVYQKVVHLLETYFCDDEESEENHAPIAQGNTFAFSGISNNNNTAFKGFGGVSASPFDTAPMKGVGGFGTSLSTNPFGQPTAGSTPTYNFGAF